MRPIAVGTSSWPAALFLVADAEEPELVVVLEPESEPEPVPLWTFLLVESHVIPAVTVKSPADFEDWKLSQSEVMLPELTMWNAPLTMVNFGSATLFTKLAKSKVYAGHNAYEVKLPVTSRAPVILLRAPKPSIWRSSVLLAIWKPWTVVNEGIVMLVRDGLATNASWPVTVVKLGADREVT